MSAALERYARKCGRLPLQSIVACPWPDDDIDVYDRVTIWARVLTRRIEAERRAHGD